MKIASVFKGGITVCLFIIIIFTFVNSVSYEQESKENVQRQDMNTVTGMRAVKTDSGSLPQNLENKYDMPGAFYDNQLSGSAGSGELFNDPFLSRKWREWPEKDFFYFAPTDSIYNFVNPLQMRTLLQNHQHMMKEIQKYFEFKLPHQWHDPDSVFYYHFNDKEYIPIKTFILNKKI